MSKRRILLIKQTDDYTIHFDIASNAWTTYIDFLSCLKIIEREKTVASVILDFSELRSSLYPEVAVSIAALVDYYRESLGWSFTCHHKKDSYIAHANLLAPKRIERNKRWLSRNIFDKVIRFENANDAALISRTVYQQLVGSVVCEEGVLSGLGWCINEIMDNVFTHADTGCGYFMAQIHNRKKIITVSVFDLGCGLFNSLRRSPNIAVLNEMEAIELALQRGITENKQIGQGTGLYGLQRIVEHNGSHFSILSGRCSITYDYDSKNVSKKTRTPILSKAKRGTRVDFTINYSARIDLRLALGGYEMLEDFDMEMDDIALENGWLHFDVSERSGGDFGSRPSGQKMRIELLNFLKGSKERVIVDFQNVSIVSSSFADEFLGRLVKEIGFIGFTQRVQLLHVNKDVQVILERAISMRASELFDS